MSRDFPDFIDPWKAADGKRVFAGTIPLRRMSRLAPLLAPAETDSVERPNQAGARYEDARFRAAFDHDRQGAVTIRIEVEAELPLVCQRSLEPYLEEVRRTTVLAVVESLEEQDLLPDDYEPVLVAHGRLALSDLVEDELLLGVPQIPRNPEAGSVAVSTDSDVDPAAEKMGPTYRPFHDLAGLLKENNED